MRELRVKNYSRKKNLFNLDESAYNLVVKIRRLFNVRKLHKFTFLIGKIHSIRSFCKNVYRKSVI